MKFAKGLFASAAIVAAMLALSAWAWPRAPEMIASHFDSFGRANGWATKPSCLLGLPALAAAMSLLFAGLPHVMPKSGRLERSAGPYQAVWIGITALLAVSHATLVLKALGYDFDAGAPSLAAMGLLIAVIGDLLPKIRFNYVMGVRTPWTRADERVWDKTHRFTGPLMLVGGLVLAAGALIPPLQALRPALVMVCVALPGLAGVVYSYVVARKLGV